MVAYLRDRDQRKAFLAGACGPNPANMKEKLAESQADWDNLGGDRAHVYSKEICSVVGSTWSTNKMAGKPKA